MRPSQISIVLAKWCPHCVPLSLDATEQIARDLKLQYRVLDIDDPEKVKIADDLVKKYGDDAVDYLIPQVFLEYPDGSVKHIFTGFSEGTDVTEKHWKDFFSSQFYQNLK